MPLRFRESLKAAPAGLTILIVTALGVSSYSATSVQASSEKSGSHHHAVSAPRSDSVNGAISFTGEPAPKRRGRFIVHCQPTVRDVIDPVVTPGVYGRSHSHDFYGPKEIHTHPTAALLVSATPETSCSDRADKSIYWHPTLLHHGKMVTPQRMQAYYHISEFTRHFPAGLSYIVGSPGTQVTDGVRARWICGGDGDDQVYRFAVSCEQDEYLMAAVSFPGCWDGVNLTAEDYGAHMAYSDEEGRCPSSHPIHVPQLDLFIQWDCNITCGETEGLALSSGTTGGWHGDVIFNWKPAHLKGLISRCQDKDCGVLGNEQASSTLNSATAFNTNLEWPQIANHSYLSSS